MSKHSKLQQSIVLTGPMGSGKSTVGRRLADRLSLPFYDLDTLIVEHEGCSIQELFETRGESGFRTIESTVLTDCLTKGAMVLSVGGGTVLRVENRTCMKKLGLVVNLHCSLEVLEERLSRSTHRPLLNTGEPRRQIIERLLSEREQYYADCDIRVDAGDGDHAQVVGRIVTEIENYQQKRRIVTVPLGAEQYDITIANGCLEGIGAACRRAGLAGQMAIVTNPTVAPYYQAVVEASLKRVGYDVVTIIIPDGEEYKNTQTLNGIYDGLVDAGLDRGSVIVALGGGVVGDMAGFAAATYMRGIAFVQIPTTLLAQVDSSVGGKTGIDHPRGKNLIGAFYQPKLVFADMATLVTLEERHYRAGLAEVVKYGVVLDSELFEFLERSVAKLLVRDAAVLSEVVARCCAIKARVVTEDEKEAGIRAVLNYGHTLGHAYESLAGYRDLVHGEAVAIGVVKAARLSVLEGYAREHDYQRIEALLVALKLPVQAPWVEAETLVRAVSTDKKNRSGSITFICNKGIGDFQMYRITPDQLVARVGGEYP